MDHYYKLGIPQRYRTVVESFHNGSVPLWNPPLWNDSTTVLVPLWKSNDSTTGLVPLWKFPWFHNGTIPLWKNSTNLFQSPRQRVLFAAANYYTTGQMSRCRICRRGERYMLPRRHKVFFSPNSPQLRFVFAAARYSTTVQLSRCGISRRGEHVTWPRRVNVDFFKKKSPRQGTCFAAANCIPRKICRGTTYHTPRPNCTWELFLQFSN